LLFVGKDKKTWKYQSQGDKENRSLQTLGLLLPSLWNETFERFVEVVSTFCIGIAFSETN
jgi:hypothetical protein